MEKPISYFNSSEVVDLSVTSWTENILIGAYLMISGIISLILNASVIGAIVRKPSLSVQPKRKLIFHVCLAGTGMTILGGFIFSGASSLAGRWLFGDSCCLWYAFCGFFFGIASITMVFVMIYFGSGNASCNIKQRIKIGITFSWIWALSWALMPIFGWSSYNYEPSRKTCTINWKQNDPNYMSYIVCLTIFVFIIPSVVTALKVFISARGKGGSKAIDISSSGASAGNVARLKDLKMCLALTIVVVCCWSGYAILCIWVTIKPASTVSYEFSLLPPLFAKLSTILIPLVIISYDDQLREATISCLLCRKLNKETLGNPENSQMVTSLEHS